MLRARCLAFCKNSSIIATVFLVCVAPISFLKRAKMSKSERKTFEFFTFLPIFAAVKWLLRHRAGVSYLLAALMIVSVSSRMWLTHDRGYYEDFLRTAHPSEDAHAWVSCNCPICHAEDFLATEAEYFDYSPIISVLECERAIQPTATANRVVVISSLRAPPYLS